jgi:hypothetical protein
MRGHPARKAGEAAHRQEARQDNEKAGHEEKPEKKGLPAGRLLHRDLD